MDSKEKNVAVTISLVFLFNIYNTLVGFSVHDVPFLLYFVHFFFSVSYFVLFSATFVWNP